MVLDPYCHWCRRRLTYYHRFQHSKTKPLPEDFPTLDHLFSRNIQTRQQAKERNKHIVLACRSCNAQRAAKELKAHPWKQHWKSGFFPPPLRIVGHLLHAVRAFRKSVRQAKEYDLIVVMAPKEKPPSTGGFSRNMDNAKN